MAEMTLTPIRLRAGLWEGLLTSASAAPRIEALHDGAVLPALEVSALPDQPGCHAVRLSLPASVIGDGVQTVSFRDAETQMPLGHVAIFAGLAPDEDLRAEIALLRAELDLLKQAFRRHCVQSGQTT